jgi:hypothetical protein
LEAEAVQGVVHNDQILHISIFEYSQVFNMNAIGSPKTAFSAQSSSEYFLIGVDQVYNSLSIRGMGCSENN